MLKMYVCIYTSIVTYERDECGNTKCMRYIFLNIWYFLTKCYLKWDFKCFCFLLRVFFILTFSKVHYFNNHKEKTLRDKDNDSKVSLRIMGPML